MALACSIRACQFRGAEEDGTRGAHQWPACTRAARTNVRLMFGWQTPEDAIPTARSSAFKRGSSAAPWRSLRTDHPPPPQHQAVIGISFCWLMIIHDICGSHCSQARTSQPRQSSVYRQQLNARPGRRCSPCVPIARESFWPTTSRSIAQNLASSVNTQRRTRRNKMVSSSGRIKVS